jgi:hypothetical protein
MCRVLTLPLVQALETIVELPVPRSTCATRILSVFAPTPLLFLEHMC